MDTQTNTHKVVISAQRGVFPDHCHIVHVGECCLCKLIKITKNKIVGSRLHVKCHEMTFVMN